jgi:hypothetical protein
MRIRTVKPGFWKNEALAELSMSARLLFIGLWSYADREGRMEDRPKRIKAEVFPYDDCDIEKLLSELIGGGFLIRYQSFLAITNFARHQRPNVHEPASEIPAPTIMIDHDRASTNMISEVGDASIDPEINRSIPDLIPLDPNCSLKTIVADHLTLQKPEPKQKAKRHHIPDDFELDDTDRKIAAECNLEASKVFLEFKAYWKGEGTPKLNWHQTFQSRCHQLAANPQYLSGARVSPNGNGRASRPSATELLPSAGNLYREKPH